MGKTEVPAPIGRPSKHSEETVDRILDAIKGGRTITSICRDEDWTPNLTGFLYWVKSDKNGLSERYARARQIGWEIMADRIIDVAMDGSEDWIEKETERGAVTVLNTEHIQRSRLIVDTMKWVISKRVPAYGDKVTAEVVNDGLPIEFIVKLTPPKKPEASEEPAGDGV